MWVIHSIYSEAGLSDTNVVLGLTISCMHVLQVTPVESERVLTKGAYMLFYARYTTAFFVFPFFWGGVG